MQTSKKQSYSLLQKPQSHFSKNAPIKKKSSCTQTDNVGNKQHFYNFFNFSSLNDEFQENYTNAVRFLNNCHEFMNKMLLANYKECGDSEPDTSNLFRIPKIPNYFSVLLLFLNKANQNHVDINSILRNYNATLVQNKNIEVQMEEKNQESECEVIFDKKVQEESELNIFSGDLPNITSSCSGMQNFENISKSHTKICASKSKTKTVSFSASKTKIHNCELDMSKMGTTEYSKSNKITKKQISELVQAEVRKEMFQFLNKNKTESTVKAPDKENSIIAQTLEPPNELNRGGNLLGCTQKEFLGQIATKDLLKIPQETSVPKEESKIKQAEENNSEETKIKIADISPENLDLMEYSLRKLKKKVRPNSEHHPNYKMTFSECKLGQQQSSSDNYLRNDSQPSTSSTVEKLENATINSRSSSSTSASPKNTQKVNQMFQKISRESLNSQNPVSLNDQSTTNFEFDPDANKNYDGEVDYIPDCDENMIYLDNNEDDDSDCESDSIILDDEEYERNMININTQNTVGLNQTLWRTDSFSSEHSVGSSNFKKFHPLQLSEKDFNNVDDKILKTIGIFTTKGFIKPEVIDTIEEKEKMGKNQNQRNKQFRTKRRIDFEVRYKPNNTASHGLSRQCDVNVESSISEGNFSLKSDVSYSSAESISESDFAGWQNQELPKIN